MKSKLNKLPQWIKEALQGVTHWIGHRRCLYRNYPLSEGALVAEICNLIHANLPDDLTLQCEVQYSKFLHADMSLTVLTERARADLVIFERPTTEVSDPRFIIEVKRASASTAQINDDLERLASVRNLRPSVRTFLVVISEAHRPTQYVNAEGSSILGRRKIPNSDGYFRVRRTWKAAHAFKKRDSAQYACLIEVYAG